MTKNCDDCRNHKRHPRYQGTIWHSGKTKKPWWTPPEEFFKAFTEAFLNYRVDKPTIMPDARDYIYKKAPKAWTEYWKSGGWKEPRRAR